MQQSAPSSQILSAALGAGLVGTLALWPLRSPFLGLQLADQLLTLALCVAAYAAVAAAVASLLVVVTRLAPGPWPSAFTMGPALGVWLLVYVPLMFHRYGPVLRFCLATGAALAACVALDALARRWPRLTRPEPYAALLLAGVLGWVVASCLSPAARQGAPATAWLWIAPVLAGALFALRRSQTERPVARSLLVAVALGFACTVPPALLARAREPGATAAAGGRASHVVLVSIDTLRADHLGCYGNTTVKTPSLDALARESILFENTITAIPITNASHTTMLTGVYPGEHRVEGNAPEPIQGGHPTVTRLLAGQGFETAGFVSSAVLDQRASRIHSEFQAYDDDLGPLPDMPELLFRTPLLTVLARQRRHGTFLRNTRRGDETVSAAIDWLGRNAHGKFFLFVHLFDVHGPYHPPPPYDRMYDPTYRGGSVDYYAMTPAQHLALLSDPRAVQHMRALYSGGVSYADSQVGRLIEALRREKILDDTLLIVTADHGESLGEHGYYFDHSLDLHDPSLRVPLIVRLPSARAGGTRVSAITSLVDIAPTVMQVTGVRTNARFDGVSLLADLDPGNPAPDRYVYSILFAGPSGRPRMLSVRSLREKYIRISRHMESLVEVPAHQELYALDSDPGELHNLVDRDPSTLERMVALATPRWRRWFRAHGDSAHLAESSGAGETPPVKLDEETKRALKSLGYVQ